MHSPPGSGQPRWHTGTVVATGPHAVTVATPDRLAYARARRLPGQQPAVGDVVRLLRLRTTWLCLATTLPRIPGLRAGA